jgi:hypothetical protein
MSGSPVSATDARAGTDADGTFVTSHPYPSSIKNFATSVTTEAEAQFISVIVTFPQAAYELVLRKNIPAMAICLIVVFIIIISFNILLV